jgi:hypothetical protein
MKAIEMKFPKQRADYKRSSRRKATTRVRRAQRRMKTNRG